MEFIKYDNINITHNDTDTIGRKTKITREKKINCENKNIGGVI